jgi:hypothetical protein
MLLKFKVHEENCIIWGYNKLYSSPNIIRNITPRMIWEGHVACRREKRNTYKSMVRMPEGKTQLGRTTHMLEISRCV